MDVLALAKINELKRQGGVGYDTRKTAPLSIEWDGEIGGREAFGEGNEMMVKVSSSTPSFEELQAGDFLASGTDEYQKLITEDTEYHEEEGLAAIASGFIYVVYDDNNYLGLSKGVWFGKFIIGDGSIYISRMRVPSVTTGELKTIDPKFLPFETIALNTVLSDTVDTMDLTEEESALFFEASQSNKMIYVDCTINPQIMGMEMKVVSHLSRLTIEGVVTYLCTLNVMGKNISIAFQKSETAENRFSASLVVTA